MSARTGLGLAVIAALGLWAMWALASGDATREDEPPAPLAPVAEAAEPPTRGPPAAPALPVPREAEVEPALAAAVADADDGLFHLTGRVVDDRGEPVSSASLALIANPATSAPKFSVLSDDQGRFDFPAIDLSTTLKAVPRIESTPAAAELHLHARRDDHVTVDMRVLGAELSARRMDVTVTLARTGEVAGLVRRADGSIVADATAALHTVEGVLPAARELHGTGAYRLRAVPPGEHVLDVRAGTAEGLASARLTGVVVRPGERTRLDVVLGAGGTVRGRVTDADGRPVASAVVSVEHLQPLPRKHTPRVSPAPATIEPWLRAYELQISSGPAEAATRTNADGTYAFGHIAPGEKRVVVAVDDRDLVPAETVVQIEEGASRDGVDFVLAQGATLAGRVLDVDGAPVFPCSLVLVVPVDTAGGRAVRAETWSDGRFEVTGLPPGRVRLIVQAIPGLSPGDAAYQWVDAEVEVPSQGADRGTFFAQAGL